MHLYSKKREAGSGKSTRSKENEVRQPSAERLKKEVHLLRFKYTISLYEYAI